MVSGVNPVAYNIAWDAPWLGGSVMIREYLLRIGFSACMFKDEEVDRDTTGDRDNWNANELGNNKATKMVETTIVEDEDTMVMVQSEVQTEKKKKNGGGRGEKTFAGIFSPNETYSEKNGVPS